jgi:hypothetical protein
MRLRRSRRSRSSSTTARALAWPPRAARVGAVLLLLQVALAALMRHRVVGLTSHVLVGGLAATAVLVPAVAVTQRDGALVVEKRAARWAIAALLVQAFLGASLLLMVAAGTGNVPMWAAAIKRARSRRHVGTARGSGVVAPAGGGVTPPHGAS